MTTCYASATLGGDDRNVERIGLYVAWLIANDLLDDVLLKKAGSAAARVKMQDLNGAEFLTTVLHGELAAHHLGESGRRFTEAYFLSGQYDADYDAVPFKGDNEWVRYDGVAPAISRAYQQFRNPVSKVKAAGAKILAFRPRGR